MRPNIDPSMDSNIDPNMGPNINPSMKANIAPSMGSSVGPDEEQVKALAGGGKGWKEGGRARAQQLAARRLPHLP